MSLTLPIEEWLSGLKRRSAKSLYGQNFISWVQIPFLLNFKLRMFFYITVSTKEKTTLKNFLTFFSSVESLTLKILKQKTKKNVTKFITVLKSPHVNKTAQEQFEFKFFTRQMVLFSLNPFLCLFILKHITKRGFPGVKMKLAYAFDKKKHNKILLSFLNPDNIKFKGRKKRLKNYLQLFDSYGEICLQKFKTI